MIGKQNWLSGICYSDITVVIFTVVQQPVWLEIVSKYDYVTRSEFFFYLSLFHEN